MADVGRAIRFALDIRNRTAVQSGKEEYSVTKIFILIFAFVLVPQLTCADETLLADLNEEIVHIPLTIDGFFGKKETQITATIYRPQGAGPSGKRREGAGFGPI